MSRPTVKMTRHAAEQFAARGLDGVALYDTFFNPEVVYTLPNYPNQERRKGNGVVLCVDKESGVVVTVFGTKASDDE